MYEVPAALRICVMPVPSTEPRVVPQYNIRRVETADDLAQCMLIRKEGEQANHLSTSPGMVLTSKVKGYDIRIETNEDDAQCSHSLLLVEGLPAGTVRVSNTTGQLGRLALRREYRGLGLAMPLCQAVHEQIRSTGGKEVWCQSQAANPVEGGVDATGFYKRMGYVERGARYIKEGSESACVSCLPAILL